MQNVREIPCSRSEALRWSILGSMSRPKTSWNDVGAIWDAYPGVEQEPLIVRSALAVEKKLRESPITIWPDQLIAGSIVLPEQDVRITGNLPDYATIAEKEAARERGMSVHSIVGHIVPSYPKLLRMGALGIRDDAVNRGQEAKDEDARAFYRACTIVMQALADFALRHAELCRALCSAEPDPARASELAAMAEDLMIAPAHPPQSFSQAVASIWLAHLAFQLTGNHLAIGRFDQHVWPFLEADLAAGAITLAQAGDLVDCFMLKFNERAQDSRISREQTDAEEETRRNEARWARRETFARNVQRTNVRDGFDATNHWLQNVILGGVLPATGLDASNPVTFLCLDAFEKNRMTNPCLTMRVHAHTPEALLRRSCEVLRTGGGLPAFFNDEAIVPALVKWGIALEDARDYTNDGCWEIIIAGRNDFYFDRFNMLRCLEWTLNRGKSRLDGKQEAPDPGDPTAFADYETLYDTFLSMLYYLVEGLMARNNAEFGRRQSIAPVPLLSALLEGPMENGGDMTQKGAKYITYGLIAEAVSHTVDSLAAIRQVVFTKREATMDTLIDALDRNFEGYEALRKKLMAAPKYGRNQREADAIGAGLIKAFAAKVEELNKKYDRLTFLPGAGTFSWYMAIGEGLGASPDGRLACETVSSNLSPSANAATRGVTGALLSHAVIDMKDLPVGSPTDLRLAARLVQGEEGLTRLAGLIRSFVTLGDNMLTLSIADTEILRHAQQYPEQHRDLRVRMGGWSAYFTMLSKEQQEYHIQKQEEL